MKAFVLSENLLKTLVRVGRIISPRPQLPVLQYVKISARKDGIEITSTNMEMTETSWIGGKIEQEGELCVSAKIFTEFVTSLPQDTVTLETSKESLHISCAGFTASIPTVSVAEFPPTQAIQNEKLGKIDKEKFHEALSGVLFSAATDEGRPVLTGIKVKKQDGKTVFAATDGYRLSVKHINLDLPSLPDAIIPAKALSEVLKIMQEDKEEKQMSFGVLGGNQAVFGVGDTQFVTRLLDGEYPNYERIVPAVHTTQATIDKELLYRAVKSAAIFARDNANIVKLILANNKITATANAPQVGENKVELPAKIEGDGGEIAFNARFLLEYLSNFSGEELVFEMTGSLNPGVFKPVGDDSSFHIIMPVRVQG